MCVCVQLITSKRANFFNVWISTRKICVTSLWICLEVTVEGEFILQEPSKFFDLRIEDLDVWRES